MLNNPYGSKYLARKCLGYDLGGEVPSETVFGSIGYIYIIIYIYDSHFDHSILFGQMLCSRFVRLIKSHSVTWDICPRMMEKARSNATGVTQMWKLPSPPRWSVGREAAQEVGT